jgi:hypothetical protein
MGLANVLMVSSLPESVSRKVGTFFLMCACASTHGTDCDYFYLSLVMADIYGCNETAENGLSMTLHC